MINIPDHPVIRCMERTGYPFPVCEEIIGYCERCGKPVYAYDRYAETWNNRSLVCEDCMMADDEPMWEED